MDEETKMRIAREASKFDKPEERERYIKGACAIWSACEEAVKFLKKEGALE